MPEKAPVPATSEKEEAKKLPFHEEIAGKMIDKYVGDIDDDTRGYMTAVIADEVKRIHNTYQSQPRTDEILDAQKKEFAELITSLRRDGDPVSEGSTSSVEATKDASKEANGTKDTPEATSETETPKSENEAKAAAARELPTTKELKSAAKDPEVGFVKRSWNALNFRAGLGIMSAYDFVAKRREKHMEKARPMDGETKEEYEKRIRKMGRRANLGAAAIAGAVLIAKYGIPALREINGGHMPGFGEQAADQATQVSVSGVGHSDPTELKPGTDPSDYNQGNGVDQYGHNFNPEDIKFGGYNASLDDFYDQGKVREHNWGTPLEQMAGDSKFNNIAGVEDLINRQDNSPARTGVAYTEMFSYDGAKMDSLKQELGLPSDASQAEVQRAFDEYGKTHPEWFEAKSQEVQDLMRNSNWSNETHDSVGSYSQVDADGNIRTRGDLVMAYDPHVTGPNGEPVKLAVQEFKGTDGQMHKVYWNIECGQICHPNVKNLVEVVVPKGTIVASTEQSAAPAVHTETTPAPEGNGPAPQPEQPQVPGVPGTPDVPTTPDNPGGGGETPETPITPEPKNEQQNILNNPNLREGLGNADDRFDSGPLKEATTPQDTYVPNLQTPVDSSPTDSQPAANSGRVED